MLNNLHRCQQPCLYPVYFLLRPPLLFSLSFYFRLSRPCAVLHCPPQFKTSSSALLMCATTYIWNTTSNNLLKNCPIFFFQLYNLVVEEVTYSISYNQKCNIFHDVVKILKYILKKKNQCVYIQNVSSYYLRILYNIQNYVYIQHCQIYINR